ncbi:MAG: WGR domain-containing protein [bacterium]|nr:WGR domain-containing protein [bacterium]
MKEPKRYTLRLQRTDPDRNMARFYAMYIAPSLFGDWGLIREWGRIGSPGTVRIDSFETLEETEEALFRIEKEKRKKGYMKHGEF